MRSSRKLSGKGKHLPISGTIGRFLFFPAILIFPGLFWILSYVFHPPSNDLLNFGPVGAYLLFITGIQVASNYLLIGIPYLIFQIVRKKKGNFWHFFLISLLALLLWGLRFNALGDIGTDLIIKGFESVMRLIFFPQ